MRFCILSLALAGLTSINAAPVDDTSTTDGVKSSATDSVTSSATESATASLEPSASGSLVIPAGTKLNTKIAKLAKLTPSNLTPAEVTELAALVCGSSESDHGPMYNRNADTWEKYKMDDYFASMTDFPTNAPPASYVNLQDWVDAQCMNDGINPCVDIGSPQCGNDYGSDVLCNQSPQAHFAMGAVQNWANFMHDLDNTLTQIVVWLNGYASVTVSNFFPAQKAPSNYVLLSALIGGIASIITACLTLVTGAGIIGIISGLGTIMSGYLTQLGLDRPDSNKQFEQLQKAYSQTFKQIVLAWGQTFKDTLHQWPAGADSTSYGLNPIMLPQLSKGGGLAARPYVDPFQNGTLAPLSSGGINSLWASDGVYITVLTDDLLGQGSGAACKVYPDLTLCSDDGKTAYIWAAFKTHIAHSISTIDQNNWYVRGAYTAGGKDGQGNVNANYLGDYGLDLVNATKSVQISNANKPFPNSNQNGLILDYFQKNPLGGDIPTLMAMSLPYCDLGAYANGKAPTYQQYKTTPQWVAQAMVCGCFNSGTWPTFEKDDKGVANPYYANKVLSDKVCRRYLFNQT